MGSFDPKPGDVFGKLTLLAVGSQRKENGHYELVCVCRCECGEQIGIARYQLAKRLMCFTCAETERRKKIATHGLHSAPGYHSWMGINNRCLDPANHAYRRYGGTGITICERWHRENPDGLKNFLADMGPKPGSKFSVDRIDNGKGYEPINCRWASPKTQQNNRRNNIQITIDGVTKPVAVWASEAGIKRAALLSRYQTGVRGADLLAPTQKAGPRFVTVNGETKQLHEWAAISGVSANAIRLRLDNGTPPEIAIAAKADRGKRLDGLMRNQNRADSNMLTASGKTQCVAAWARETGLSEGALRYRIRMGWKPEDVIGKGSNKEPLTINGETKSIGEWAAISGLSRDTITKRIKKGLTNDQLIATPMKGKPWSMR